MSAYLNQLMGNNEKPVFITRKHVIVVARALLGGIVAAIIIVGGAAFVASAQITGIPTFPVGLVLGLLAIIPLIYVARTWVAWQNEEYIVTNRRVIKIEGVVNKHVFDSSLEKVNDVELNQPWLGRLLNYGDVEIITGSDIGENKFMKIASPLAFKRELLNQKESLGVIDNFSREEKGVIAGSAQAPRDIPTLISELDELHKKGVINDAEFEAKKADLLKRM